LFSRRMLAAAAVACVALGCGGSKVTNAASSSASPKVKVTKNCPYGGVLGVKTSGFTPGGTYKLEGLYPPFKGAPKGSPRLHYTYIDPKNRIVKKDGTLKFKWDCSKGEDGHPDPPGEPYTLTFTDVVSGKKVTINFKVLPKS
jgi:hypothetical protein